MPIHQLLNRIRWDREYAKAQFKIGYYDRVEDRILVTSMQQVYFEPNNHFSIEVIAKNGESHMVPLHRIRQVYRNNLLIWERRL